MCAHLSSGRLKQLIMGSEWILLPQLPRGSAEGPALSLFLYAEKSFIMHRVRPPKIARELFTPWLKSSLSFSCSFSPSKTLVLTVSFSCSISFPSKALLMVTLQFVVPVDFVSKAQHLGPPVTLTKKRRAARRFRS